jgi:hypothetical protein
MLVLLVPPVGVGAVLISPAAADLKGQPNAFVRKIQICTKTFDADQRTPTRALRS